MAISIADNYDIRKKSPDVERQLFQTVSDMVAYNENWLPDIYYCDVIENGKRYRFDRSNTPNELGRWRVVEGSGSTEVYFTTTSPITNKIGEFDLAEEITEADKITLNEVF